MMNVEGKFKYRICEILEMSRDSQNQGGRFPLKHPFFDRQDSAGTTPLLAAAAVHNAELVAELLKGKASLEMRRSA